MCSWWRQAGHSTWCHQRESWGLSRLSHLSYTAGEAHLVSQCTSELKHTQTQVTLVPNAYQELDFWCTLGSKIYSGCTASYSRLQWLTSRHDVAHILYSEGRIFVLCVDPDHPVAQAAHGQDGPCWQRSSTCTRPGGRTKKRSDSVRMMKQAKEEGGKTEDEGEDYWWNTGKIMCSTAQKWRQLCQCDFLHLSPTQLHILRK